MYNCARTVEIEKLWPKVVAMHACGVSVYFVYTRLQLECKRTQYASLECCDDIPILCQVLSTKSESTFRGIQLYLDSLLAGILINTRRNGLRARAAALAMWTDVLLHEKRFISP